MIKKNSNIIDKWYFLLPLMFLLAVVPLIVYLKIIPLTGVAFDFWTGQNENYDFFSYYKMVWILISTAIAVVTLVFVGIFYGFDQIRGSYYYIPMAVYAFFVILSTEFSQYTDISLTGFTDRHEGMYVLLAYMAMLFVTINLVKQEEHIKILFGALFTGAIIVGLIGAFQFIGYDFFKTSLGKGFILPETFENAAATLQFQFGKNVIYSTLYHLNYVGSYMAMLFPLSFTMFVLTKKRWLKMLFALLTLLMTVNWLGSTSRAGMLGGFMAVMILIIMINKVIRKDWKYFLGGLIVVGVLIVGLNFLSSGYLGSRINSLINNAKEITQSTGTDDAKANMFLQGLEIEGNQVTLTTLTETLEFTLKGNDVDFRDKEGNPINVDFVKGKSQMILLDERYKDYKFLFGKLDKKKVLQMQRDSLEFNFEVAKDGVKLLDIMGNEVSLEPVERWGFEGKELLGSSRGYIWSRSIPLLKNTILVGYGPDTFAIYFPQHDFMGKYYAYNGDMWQVVDKPHNLYLQIGLNTGIMSLLALLILFIVYFVRSVRIYIRNDYSSFVSCAGVGIFVAICGYLGAAFFNDSVVSVAPVFWVLLGIGISANYMLEQQNKALTAEMDFKEKDK